MTDSIGTGVCESCGQLAKQFCASCKGVFYCSRDCQKKAWKTHKTICRPFAVINHPVYGRYAVATREIKAGEVLLKEAPLVLGPKQCTLPLCLGCHRKLSEVTLCKRCRFPLCASSCQNSKYHKDECSILAKASSPLKFPEVGVAHPAYECITPLRCLLLKKIDSAKWERLINLQSHLEDIRKTSIYNVNQTNIVDFIRVFLGYKNEGEDDELVHRICGILLTNCFELAHKGQRIRGLYEKASMFAHNCIPNTKHVFDSDKNIIFRATQTIAKGAPIFATYSHTLWDTYSRRQHLKTVKFFLCTCKRCADPTEMETNLSTLLCSKCGGEVRSTAPLEQDATWACIRCDNTLMGKQIAWGNDMLNRELRSFGQLDPSTLESFIDRYSKTLHYNHRFNLEAKYALLKLFGNHPDFRYRSLSQKQIENKVKWCQELLALAAVIDPCKSLLRGNLLFELQAALVAKGKVLLSNDLITDEKAMEYMNEAVVYLQEATEILKHEPDLADGGLDVKLKYLSEELEI